VTPALVVWIHRIEGNVAKGAIGKLGDSNTYKVVVIVREGAIGNSLVPEYWITS